MGLLHRIVVAFVMLAVVGIGPGAAQTPERRLALVVGNSEYKAGQLPTAANDAGLIAEALRAAGFDVSGARDLDQDTLRRSVREFFDKVSAAGPEAVTLVYVAGYGVQFEGENYIVPVDATLRRDEDIPIEAVRISDIVRPLAGLPGTVKLVVIDAARQTPFTPAGAPLASGLALVEPDAGTLIAYNATPGSIAPIEPGPYGAFAQALAEMIGTGGLGLDDVFTRVRLRVNDKTGGVMVPWYASRIARPFVFMERAPDAPPPPEALAAAQVENRPLRDFQGDQPAYTAALTRDTLDGYEEFLALYPDSPLATRVRALVAVRREAITWRRTLAINAPEAYWSYLRRYPRGAHVADAQRRLAMLAAAFDPPPAFMPMAYDVPPPPPDEVVYLAEPVVFDGPGFLPPPPAPLFFLPPPPPAFILLAPPPPPAGPFFLPVPAVAIAGPGGFARAPAFVRLPPPVAVQQISLGNQTFTNRAGATPGVVTPAVALPAAVVTRVNSGALRAPPPAAPPPAPLRQTATLTGAGVLGNPAPTRPQGLGPLPAGQVPGAQGPAGAGPAVPQGLLTPRLPATAVPAVPPAVTTLGVVPPAPQPPRGTAAATTGVPRLPGAQGVTPLVPTQVPAQVPGQVPPPGAGRQPDRRLPNVRSAVTPSTGTATGAAVQSTGPKTPGPPRPAVGGAPVAAIPPSVNRPAEPAPPAAHPPAVVNRPPPPPPQAAVHPVAPAPVNRPPPPPAQAAARPAPPPAAKKCVEENGKQVCR